MTCYGQFAPLVCKELNVCKHITKENVGYLADWLTVKINSNLRTLFGLFLGCNQRPLYEF